MDEGKKKIVITGYTVLRIIAVLVIISSVVYTILAVRDGTPILDVFRENLLEWLAVLGCFFVVLFYDKKKPKD